MQSRYRYDKHWSATRTLDEELRTSSNAREDQRSPPLHQYDGEPEQNQTGSQQASSFFESPYQGSDPDCYNRAYPAVVEGPAQDSCTSGAAVRLVSLAKPAMYQPE